MPLCDVLREAREVVPGMTQAKAAQGVRDLLNLDDFSFQAISAYEIGRVLPSPPVLAALAKLYQQVAEPAATWEEMRQIEEARRKVEAAQMKAARVQATYGRKLGAPEVAPGDLGFRNRRAGDLPPLAVPLHDVREPVGGAPGGGLAGRTRVGDARGDGDGWLVAALERLETRLNALEASHDKLTERLSRNIREGAHMARARHPNESWHPSTIH